MAVTSEVMTIDPAIAERILARNTMNRPIGRKHVERLTRTIKNKEWVLNYESIKIAADGTLIDGQHRLLAVIAAKTPITTLVMRGVDKEVFSTIDTGRRRNAAQCLALSGEKHYVILASSVRTYIQLNVKARREGKYYKNVSLTNKDIELVLKDIPNIRNSIRFGRGCEEISCKSLVTCLHFIFSKNPERAAQADTFFLRLADGVGLEATSPILTLRSRLIKDRGSRRKLPVDEVCALIIKAWNAYASGQVIKTLRWTTSVDEAFPVPLDGFSVTDSAHIDTLCA